MYFLVSGEGPTDIGSGRGAGTIHEGDDFLPGPMTAILKKVIGHEAPQLKYTVVFISESSLVKRFQQLKAKRKSFQMPSKKRPGETLYFRRNAETLGLLANEVSTLRKCPVIPVLFRDADGKSNAGRGEWEAKYESMKQGYSNAKCSTGVAMIPKPKSEAWLICILKFDPYQRCDRLEARSGNDKSPKNLKDELERIVKKKSTREDLCHLVSVHFDPAQMAMPSFVKFRSDLLAGMQAESNAESKSPAATSE
ncbi:MAG: hypothetical protein ACRCZF_03180 [Gemmataceae bacterium]